MTAVQRHCSRARPAPICGPGRALRWARPSGSSHARRQHFYQAYVDAACSRRLVRASKSIRASSLQAHRDTALRSPARPCLQRLCAGYGRQPRARTPAEGPRRLRSSNAAAAAAAARPLRARRDQLRQHSMRARPQRDRRERLLRVGPSGVAHGLKRQRLRFGPCGTLCALRAMQRRPTPDGASGGPTGSPNGIWSRMTV